MKININKYKELSGCDNYEIIISAFRDAIEILGSGYVEEYYWNMVAQKLCEYYISGYEAGKK